jgi:hypothetical protein
VAPPATEETVLEIVEPAPPAPPVVDEAILEIVETAPAVPEPVLEPVLEPLLEPVLEIVETVTQAPVPMVEPVLEITETGPPALPKVQPAPLVQPAPVVQFPVPTISAPSQAAPSIKYAPGEAGKYRLQEADAEVRSVAIAPDKSLALAALESRVYILNLQDGKQEVFQKHKARVTCVAFHPAGQHAMTGDADGKLLVWHVRSREVVLKLEGHVGAVHQVAAANGCALAVSGGEDFTLRVWSTKSGKQLRWFKNWGPVTAVTFSPSDSLVAMGTKQGDILLCDTQKLKVLQELEHPPKNGRIASVRFSPNGFEIGVGAVFSGMLARYATTGVWARRDQRYRKSGSVSVENAFQLVVLPDCARMLCGGGPEEAASAGGSVVHRFTTVRVVATKIEKKLVAFKGHQRRKGPAEITCVAVSPDGTVGISGGNDSQVLLWGLP